MRAAIYLRVSTDKQEADNQGHQLINYCESKKWEIVETYQDIASGMDPGRNAFNRMMKDARLMKWEILVFWAWDRITRRGIETALSIMRQLLSYGIEWVSLKEPFLSSAEDWRTRELVLSIMAWVAERERERISERTKAAMARRKALGHPVGRPKGTKDKKPRTRRWRKRPVFEEGH